MLTKIHHVGVAVRSADDALRFYRDVLGLAVTKDAVLEEQAVRGVLLSAGESEIELLEPQRPDSPVGRFLDSRGEGLHHLCFATNDIEGELAAAKAKALPLIDEHPRQGLAGMIAFLHPKATCGVLVEYAQPPALTTPLSPSPRGKGESGEQAAPVFDHLAVAVSDLEAGAHAFSANFGLAPSAARDSATLGICAVTLPIGNAYIGVVTPLGADTEVARFIARRGEGLYLISLAVASLEDCSARLSNAGLRITSPVSTDLSSNPVPSGEGGPNRARVAFVSPRSAGGGLVQLIEPAAR